MKPHTVQEEQTTELVRQQNPDIELELPGRFHSKYKNPCYIERHTNRTRCIGFFSIIGVSKAGTTDVFHRLVSHPKVELVRPLSLIIVPRCIALPCTKLRILPERANRPIRHRTGGMPPKSPPAGKAIPRAFQAQPR
jgi:hypothetical protein